MTEEQHLDLEHGTICSVIESDQYKGEAIFDCQEIVLTGEKPCADGPLSTFLKNGWKVVTIAWIPKSQVIFGETTALHYELRAVIVRTEKN